MSQRFYLCRLRLFVLIAVMLSASEVAGARAACPNVSAAYSANLHASVSAGVASADSACTEGDPNGGACNSFVGMILDKTYGHADFATKGGYLSTAAINAYVPTSPAWTDMGSAGNQGVLSQAQTDANNGAPVIALSGDQVALLIPSPILVHSTTWNLCVPMSAAHFSHDTSANYTSGPLSLPWQSPSGVSIWERTGP